MEKLSHYDAVLRDQLMVASLTAIWSNEQTLVTLGTIAKSDEEAVELSCEGAWRLANKMMEVRAKKISEENKNDS